VAAGDGGLNTDGKEERFVLRSLAPEFATESELSRTTLYTLRELTEPPMDVSQNAEFPGITPGLSYSQMLTG
jgi:hypothetical protein